ncbi:proline dehydrogenase family protein [Phytoactinopolyspora halotolerans]|uniref:proline dehydrogenase n=1 Tax=Phytoactinopolyspora halotolerans TaxID=1981512 RepID=A0A6L9S5J0_9ACTN|nr:proline dehydrogenase [Phytoactinopolyspora halotolerans]
MSRSVLFAAARNEHLKEAIERIPLTRRLVARYVAGATEDAVVRVAGQLVANGLNVSIDHLGEHTRDAAQAGRVAETYVSLLDAVDDGGLAGHVEVSVKLSAIGQALHDDGEKLALEHARRICQAARNAGTTVTLDMEDHTTTDSTLSILRELRLDFPETGAVLQAYLRRTEGDCRDLAYPGSRVRLCKGAYDEPPSVAFQHRSDVDRSYVRCAKILLAADCYPMLATHDPRLVEITGALAAKNRRAQGSYEYQMLYGVRPDEQYRLVRAGERVRVYVPYGEDWYGYLVRRLAERPANLSLFLRSVASKR